MKSLKRTIFFFFVILLVAVQSVFMQIIYRAIVQQERNQISYQLDTASTVFRTEFGSRKEYLAAFADTAAKDFGLKQVFQEDTRSFLVALNNHRQRIDADIALAITPDGVISSQLVNVADATGNYSVKLGSEQGSAFRYPEWLELQNDSRLYPLDGAYYQLSLAPLTSGTVIIGWIGFGYNIDQRLAAYFADMTELTTDFAVTGDSAPLLLASSRGLLVPEQAAAESALLTSILQQGPGSDLIATTLVLGETDSGALVAVMYGDRTGFLAGIRNQGWELVLLAILTLSLSLGGAFVIATRISRPAQVLALQAKQIAGGNYDMAVDIQSGGELGELAKEFRHMQDAVLSRERIISFHAYHDDLTGLPNRNRLLQILDDWTGERDLRFSVIKFSIRRISEINASFGHEIGDKVICTVAGHMQQLTSGETLFHLGGSEYVLLRRHEADHDIDESLFMLLKRIEPQFRYQGITLFIEMQVGIAVYPRHESKASNLLQKASIAMHHAQKMHMPFQFYSDELTRDNLQFLQLINDLKSAIDSGQLTLHYQPKLLLHRNEIHHVEALVRWRHPQLGMIPPDHFIEIAEQTGLIDDLTCWVLREATRQYQAWIDGGRHLAIAVNISPHNLRDAHFHDKVMLALQHAGMPASALTLEMTERAVVDDMEATSATLARFEKAGVRLSIDDFGTGYSSLIQLKKLPVSELKIDKSFVTHLLDENTSQVIVRSSIELAHNMGLTVVAEGVEDEATQRWLRRNGCDQSQGYYIARPQDAASLLQCLDVHDEARKSRKHAR